MPDKRLHAIIRGDVQGVLLRANTEAKAGELGLTGWVRNVRDGSVECVAEGEEARLNELVAWWKSSPGAAEVSTVEVIWEAATGEFSGFEVLPTADFFLTP